MSRTSSSRDDSDRDGDSDDNDQQVGLLYDFQLFN